MVIAPWRAPIEGGRVPGVSSQRPAVVIQRPALDDWCRQTVALCCRLLAAMLPPALLTVTPSICRMPLLVASIKPGLVRRPRCEGQQRWPDEFALIVRLIDQRQAVIADDALSLDGVVDVGQV